MKIIVLLSLLVLLILLIQNKYKPSILFTSLASIYLILDFISFEKFAISFVNSSLLTLVLLLIVSIALEKTIFLEYFSKAIIKKNYKTTLLKLGLVTSVFSAFLNNTAVVASLMGVIKNNKYHNPSKLLIPLSYFAIFGGTMTLIGTSTNLLVNSFVIQNGIPSLEIFDFFYVGFFITLFGVLSIYIFSFLLPSYEIEKDEIQEHLIEAKISPTSTMINKSIIDNGLRNLEYLFLIEINRNGKIISPVPPTEIIEKDDSLLFSGDIHHIEVLKRFSGLNLVDDTEIGKLTLVDVIITPDSNLVNKKVKDANFRSKFNAVIISLKRGSLCISKIGDEILQAGDRLVLSVGKDFDTRDNINKNFYTLSKINQTKKFGIEKSLTIFLGFVFSIFLSAVGFLSLFKLLLIYLFILILFKIIKIDEIKRRFPYDIFLIIGSSLVVSKVLITSGLAKDFADIIINSFGIYGVYGSFIGIYLLTFFLTELITNNAAAALSFPIAFATAVNLDVNILPFVFAVAFGASASFMLPYGYQTNLMVSSLGNYKIKDFFKIGWIISIVYSIVVIVFVPFIFPF